MRIVEYPLSSTSLEVEMATLGRYPVLLVDRRGFMRQRFPQVETIVGASRSTVESCASVPLYRRWDMNILILWLR